jgi:CRISPR/Cas system Type II protein with McrA/HNH and RuvC-like nuclease domain
LRIRKLRSKQHPFKSKLYDFLYIKRPYQSPKKPIYTDKKLLYTKIHHFNKKGEGKTMITIEQIIERFSDNAICYLTGEPIDITKPRTYQFDHKIPVSKNGDNSIDNLGLCTKEVNLAKRDLTPDEFIALCKKVLVHQGYTVEKSNNT